MTPSIPATLCDPFEGARLLCTAPITGIFGAPVPANARLIAGEIDSTERRRGSTERRRFLTVTGRSPLGVAVEVNTWEEDWDKLILLLDSPLAMCHAARWLATRLGCDPGATAPPWFYDADTDAWRLHGMKTTVFFHGDSEGERRFFGRGRLVPDIHKVTDPAEALAAACLAVGGAS